MKLHKLSKLQVEISRTHLSECYWSNTSSHIDFGHSLSNITRKPRHISSRTIIVHSLTNTTLSFNKHIIRNTLITCIISCTIDTIFEAFLTIFYLISNINIAKVIHRALIKTFDFIEGIWWCTIRAYCWLNSLITNIAIDTVMWYTNIIH
jgi:hypothetical protein